MPGTIKDVARLANVSAATVSLVLNGKGDISPATRARVAQAASSLAYVPRAQRAARGADEPVLVFLKIAKHGHTVNLDHSAFISDYIDGLSAEAARRGYRLEVISHRGRPIAEVLDSLVGTAARGAAILGTELSEEDIALLSAAPLPKVFVDTFFEAVGQSFVNMDNHDAVAQVVRRMAGQGFRRVGFVGSYVDTRNFALRQEAFVRAVAANGLTLRPEDVVQVDSTFEGAQADMAALLRGRSELPECLFCVNDITAFGCIKALRQAGLRVPRDVAVIGFDNLPLSPTIEPALTTVEVSKRKIGNLAVALLDDLVTATGPQPPIKILVGARLVARDSDQAALAEARPAMAVAGSP